MKNLKSKQLLDISHIVLWCHKLHKKLKKKIYMYHYQGNLFFFPHNFISPYLHFFVTTRQSSTYKQSTSDSEVRKLDCIRTLVTSYDNETHNNAPKATGNGLNSAAPP